MSGNKVLEPLGRLLLLRVRVAPTGQRIKLPKMAHFYCPLHTFLYIWRNAAKWNFQKKYGTSEFPHQEKILEILECTKLYYYWRHNISNKKENKIIIIPLVVHSVELISFPIVRFAVLTSSSFIAIRKRYTARAELITQLFHLQSALSEHRWRKLCESF